MPKNTISRRSILLAGLGVAGAGALTARSDSTGTSSSSGAPDLVSPSGDAVRRAEDARSGTGRVRQHSLTAVPAALDLGGGVTARTWAFGERTPGQEIRITAGDTLAADVVNRLPGGATTSIHLARPAPAQRHGRRAAGHPASGCGREHPRLPLRRRRPRDVLGV
jgi:FtsP/CotA-like multicopper oxidase with cupredoxin domain